MMDILNRLYYHTAKKPIGVDNNGEDAWSENENIKQRINEATGLVNRIANDYLQFWG